MTHSSAPKTASDPPLPTHETTDARLVGVVAFAGGVVMLVTIGFLVSWWMFLLLSNSSGGSSPLTSLDSSPRRLPPPPRLEGLQSLSGATPDAISEPAPQSVYGWADREKGYIRIPISNAMEVIADRYASQTPEQNANHGSQQERQTVPRPASSGRDPKGVNP